MREFRDLTHRQQRRILDEVDRKIGTFRTSDPEDVVRYAIDAYLSVVGDDDVAAAYDQGVQDACDGTVQKAS